MKQQLILGVVISAMPIPPHAYQSASAQNFSAEVLLGVAHQDTDFGGGDRASGSSTSFGVRGAYTFNPNVAVELSYQYYGSYDDSWQDQFGWVDEAFTSSSLMCGVEGSLPWSSAYPVGGSLDTA